MIPMADKYTGRKESLIQFIKFGIVGVSNTLISYVIYLVSIIAMEKLNVFQGIDHYIANVIQFILSVLWSFYWNNRFVFTVKEGESRNLLKSLIKTYISYSFTGLILSSILLYVWVELLGINKAIAPLFSLIVSVPVNFLLNKLWAFKKEK